MRRRAGRLATIALAAGCVLVSWPLWVQVLPARAQSIEVPPADTVVLLVAVSDGMELDAVGQAMIPPGAICGDALDR